MFTARPRMFLLGSVTRACSRKDSPGASAVAPSPGVDAPKGSVPLRRSLCALIGGASSGELAGRECQPAGDDRQGDRSERSERGPVKARVVYVVGVIGKEVHARTVGLATAQGWALERALLGQPSRVLEHGRAHPERLRYPSSDNSTPDCAL
jgi:hypothetical protein